MKISVLVLLLGVFVPSTATADWVVDTSFQFPISIWDKYGAHHAKQATIKVTVPGGKVFTLKRQFYDHETEEVWFPKDFKGTAGYLNPGKYSWEVDVDGKMIVGQRFRIYPLEWKTD